MSKIYIKENSCQIVEENDLGLLWGLDKELSFKVQGAEYTRAYKTGYFKDGQHIIWDGIHRILNEDLSFPIGLLERVKDFYTSAGRKIEIVDTRPEKSALNSIEILTRLKSMGKTPYPYQMEVAEKIKKYDHGILRMATGSGKTIVCTLITSVLGLKTIIFVIGTDLLYQTHKFFSSVFDQKIGIVGDGLCEIHDINIVSVWTAGQALGIDKNSILLESEDEKAISVDKYDKIKDMLTTTKVAIYDECHLCSATTFQELSKIIKAEYIYGMSASPWRDDNSDMLIEGMLGKTIVDISASELIRKGFLIRPLIKFLNVPEYHESLKKQQYKTVYKKYIIDNEVRNKLAVRATVRLLEQGYKPLVLFNNISHGDILYKMLAPQIKCALLSGKDSSEQRERVKSQLEDGTINCILASKIMDIGVDIPVLSGLVAAGAGKSSVRALQRIGRVIRLHPSKKQAAVVEFNDHAPFLKDHSARRREIYSIEPEFKFI